MDQSSSFRHSELQNSAGTRHFRIRYEFYHLFPGKKAAWIIKEIDLGEITLKEAIEEFKKIKNVQKSQFGDRVRNFGLYKLEKLI